MIISAIAAVAENNVIGRESDLPWHLPDDMKFFQRTTRGHHVITGRKNYETIPLKYRPLKDRVNIIVTRNKEYEAPGAIVEHSLDDAIEIARKAGEDELFIIGGGQVYREAFAEDVIDKLYLTIVHAQVEGDTLFPTVDPQRWKEVSREHHAMDEKHEIAFSFVVLERLR